MHPLECRVRGHERGHEGHGKLAHPMLISFHAVGPPIPSILRLSTLVLFTASMHSLSKMSAEQMERSDVHALLVSLIGMLVEWLRKPWGRR